MRLAGWLSGFEPSHIGKQNKSLCLTLAAGVCRGGGWVGGKPSLPGAACSALSGSGGAPRVELLGRDSSFPLPHRKARDTHMPGTTAEAFPPPTHSNNKRAARPALRPQERPRLRQGASRFYHDAIFVKRNNFNLLLRETFGGGVLAYRRSQAAPPRAQSRARQRRPHGLLAQVSLSFMSHHATRDEKRTHTKR